MQLPTREAPAAQVRSDSYKRYLSGAIFSCFLLFAILLPWSVKGARYAWIAAFYLCAAGCIMQRKRLRPQPLAAPMLAYISFSALSCVFSYEPYMSWPHMRLVCWTALVATLFAQNLTRMSQVRTLFVLLLVSAAGVGVFTAYQYVRGIGLHVDAIAESSPLYYGGLRSDDTLVALNGHPLHSELDLVRAASGAPADAVVSIRFLRGSPVRKKETAVRAKDFVDGAALTPTIKLSKAVPLRAQGTIGHYGRLAELMAPIACLAWALMLGAGKRWEQLQFAVLFLLITATVFATQSRSALGGLLAGCFIALLLIAPRRTRVWLISGLVVLAVGATLWIQHKRGLKWVDLRDPGTQYRLLMWEDGARLALQHPLFGVGMDSVQNHWPEWKLRGFAQYRQFWNFHSDPVQLAAERGLLTLAAWLWFVGAYLVYLVRLLRKLRARSQLGYSVATGVFTAFIAFLVTSLVEYSLGDDSLVMLIFFCVGVAIAMEGMPDDASAIAPTG